MSPSSRQPDRERLGAGFKRLLWAERNSGELITAANADFLLAAVVAEIGVEYEPHQLSAATLRSHRTALSVRLAEALQARALDGVELAGPPLSEVLSADELVAVQAPKGWPLRPRPPFWRGAVPLFVTREMQVKVLGDGVYILSAHAWSMLRVLREVGVVKGWGMI